MTFALTRVRDLHQDGIDCRRTSRPPSTAQMKVGAIEESITVSGQSPAVDVQNAQRTTVLTRDLLDAVPVPRMYQAEGALAVGHAVERSERRRRTKRGESASDGPS